VGIGQDEDKRKIKLSTTVLLCETCSAESLDKPIQAIARESFLNVRRKPEKPATTPLFDGVEA
jgi:hypothetical protein